MEKNNILFAVIIIAIIYLFINQKKVNKEDMTNTTGIAQADIDSFKTLAELAKKLQEGGLEIPGDVKIKGTLTVEKQALINSTRQGDDAFRVFLPGDKYFYMNGSSQFGIWSGSGAQPMNFNSPINGTTTFGGVTNFNAGINVTGDSTINSSVLKIGDQAKNQWVIHTPADDRGLLMFARTKRDGNINWEASMYIDSTADGANIGTFVARNANHTNIKMGDANMNYDAAKKIFTFDKPISVSAVQVGKGMIYNRGEALAFGKINPSYTGAGYNIMPSAYMNPLAWDKIYLVEGGIASNSSLHTWTYNAAGNTGAGNYGTLENSAAAWVNRFQPNDGEGMPVNDKLDGNGTYTSTGRL